MKDINTFINEFVVKKHINLSETVDLGLPSGVQWYTCNVGANKPEEKGLFFQWGIPNSDDKKFLSKEDYIVWFKNEYPGATHQIYNMKDNCIKNDCQYDDYRIPDEKDFNELMHNTDYNETVINGVRGLTLTSKINNNSIFIPFSGTYSINEMKFKEKDTFWMLSSESCGDSTFPTWITVFTGTKHYIDIDFKNAFIPMVVRCVKDAK